MITALRFSSNCPNRAPVFRVSRRHLFAVALLLAPGVFFAQAPQTAPSPPAKTGATSAKEKAKPANASSAAEVDPAVIDSLRKAFAAQRAKGSFRALLDSSVGGNVMPSLEVEVVFPSRVRIKRSGMEIVFVGGRAMVRKGEAWTLASAEVTKFFSALVDPQDDEKMLKTATYARSLGQTKIDDRSLACYEVHNKAKGGLSKTKVFISLDDSLIRRSETKAEVQGKALISTMMIGDYGIPIQIELP
jgi:hypothetical protein